MRIFEKIGFKLILVVMVMILVCSAVLQVCSFFNMFRLVKASAAERANLAEAYLQAHI